MSPWDLENKAVTEVFLMALEVDCLSLSFGSAKSVTLEKLLNFCVSHL